MAPTRPRPFKEEPKKESKSPPPRRQTSRSNVLVAFNAHPSYAPVRPHSGNRCFLCDDFRTIGREMPDFSPGIRPLLETKEGKAVGSRRSTKRLLVRESTRYTRETDAESTRLRHQCTRLHRQRTQLRRHVALLRRHLALEEDLKTEVDAQGEAEDHLVVEETTRVCVESQLAVEDAKRTRAEAQFEIEETNAAVEGRNTNEDEAQLAAEETNGIDNESQLTTLAGRSPAPVVASDSKEPTRLCPDGHVNSLGSRDCRRCGIRIPLSITPAAVRRRDFRRLRRLLLEEDRGRKDYSEWVVGDSEWRPEGETCDDVDMVEREDSDEESSTEPENMDESEDSDTESSTEPENMDENEESDTESSIEPENLDESEDLDTESSTEFEYDMASDDEGGPDDEFQTPPRQPRSKFNDASACKRLIF